VRISSATLACQCLVAIPARLAQAMSELIEAGADRRRQLGEAARRRIETDFSLPAITRRYGDLYMSCL
jgi:glycosyltransferase involved in cell wall biosynthesis